MHKLEEIYQDPSHFLLQGGIVWIQISDILAKFPKSQEIWIYNTLQQEM